MDIRTLKYFVVVAEELNITRAADRLNLSQPPLSSQIKNLETELDTVLFIRGKRQLKLTESGQLLYRRAKEIISLTDRATSEIRSMNSGISGTISIGLVGGTASDIAADWFSEFLKEYTNVHFRIIEGSSDDLIEKMRGGLISLAVITEPYDQLFLNGFNVGRERMSVFVNKEHPLALSPCDTVDIAMLKDQPLIIPGRRATAEMIRKWFRAVNIEPNIICEIDSIADGIALAEKNVGICIFPHSRHVAQTEVVSKYISGDGKSTEYVFVWRKGHVLPVTEEKFIDHVKLICSNMQM